MIGLLADIGGTNSRYALVAEDGQLEDVCVFQNDRFPDLGAALETYLQQVQPGTHPEVGALGVAAPVTDDSVSLINIGWKFSISELSLRLGLKALHVVNDFTALAYALPCLQETDRIQVGAGRPRPDSAIAVLGPGTGFGISALVPTDGHWTAVAGEGGHGTMPAATEEEWRIVTALQKRFGHCSIERILSGPGLVNLYEIISEQVGQRRRSVAPNEVTELARGGDSVALRAVSHFFAMLGTVAGNVALTLGALGGVYIAGGIVPSEHRALLGSDFRARFENKGRYRSYMAGIPTYLIIAENPALLGLKAMIAQREKNTSRSRH